LLWITFPKLKWLFPVIESWGFEYKTCAFVWVKTNKKYDPDERSLIPADIFDNFDTFTGMGYYTRSNAEICVLATRGKSLERQCHNISQIIYAPVEYHSKKPNIVRRKIVKLFGDVPRIELFARQKTDGWDCTGNGVDNEDINISIERIISQFKGSG
jgi:N6-adenosine-specific RNA methylase IME4